MSVDVVAAPDGEKKMPSPVDRSESQGAQTVDRALQILETLGSGTKIGGWTVSEIAKELGWARPAVYRMLRPLESRRFARKIGDGRYTLGFAILELSSTFVHNFADLAAPILRELADSTGATAHLTTVEAGEAVAIAVCEPTQVSMSVAYRLGSRHPLNVGAAGRAILAGHAGDNDLICSQGELQPGAYGYAVPIMGIPHIRASVGVVSLGPHVPSEVEPLLRAAGSALAATLGAV